jgi:hypothetical protein
MSLFHVPSAVAPLPGEVKTFVPVWLQLFVDLTGLLNQGYPAAENLANGVAVARSVTIPVAKLTLGGANGSLTFTNGILTSAVNPT